MISENIKTKKRVSKKKKSSWRKHVDIQDVDKFLEEQRLEERLGQSVSSLKDDELFTLETSNKEELLTAKQKKRLRLAAPPKCFSMLQSHTKVPDPITKRNRVRTKEERMCPILKKQAQERKLKGILKPKEMQSIKDRKRHEEKKRQEQANNEINEDIWNDKGKLEEDDWIDKNTKRHTLRGTGKLNKVIPRVKSAKNTAISNVEIPHPGTSYNPSYQDHSDLLQEIAEKEIQIIKNEEHINRVTKDMFRKLPADKKEHAWLVEMSQGLSDIAGLNGGDVENEDDDKPYKPVNAPVINKKKTRQQRRKQREQLLLKQARALAKLEKKKSVDIHKLKLIKTQIDNREKKLGKLKENRLKAKSLKLGETKQLSKIKYEEPDCEFNMTQDLSGNLRNVKREGNLLTDRFKSFQKRNILEVTARHNRKKSKVKRFVKNGFKDDWKKTVAKASLTSTK